MKSKNVVEKNAMSVEPCPVCQDTKSICLPLRHQVTCTPENEMPTLQENSRYFDCPECVLKIKTEKFKAGKIKTYMDHDQFRTPEQKAWWHEGAMRSMGRMIAEKLIEDGFIEFETLPSTEYHPEGLQAKFYGALPKHFEPMEARIAERQMDVAAEVAEEAKRLIDNWGSYYHVRTISKDEAHREINAAIENVRKRRKK
jgi:hypothetical protein